MANFCNTSYRNQFELDEMVYNREREQWESAMQSPVMEQHERMRREAIEAYEADRDKAVVPYKCECTEEKECSFHSGLHYEAASLTDPCYRCGVTAELEDCPFCGRAYCAPCQEPHFCTPEVLRRIL